MEENNSDVVLLSGIWYRVVDIHTVLLTVRAEATINQFSTIERDDGVDDVCYLVIYAISRK